MVGLTYLPVMKVDQKGCSFTSCFSRRILFFSSSSLDLNTSEPGTDYVSGKYCESMKRKKRENVKAKNGWFLASINTLYLRNSRNVTGVMSQILVILPPVTSYQPKTMPDNQWMCLEGSFGSWWYASFWGFSGVKIWKLAILAILRVGSWWSRMGMNGINVNSCQHNKKLGLASCNRIKILRPAEYYSARKKKCH